MQQQTQERAGGLRMLIADWASDREAFRVRWSKAMMWIFIVGDAFVFGSFLSGYAATRLAATAPWPNTGEVFALHIAGTEIPLLLVALMTLLLLSSGGTMALAVIYGLRHDGKRSALFTALTALLGAIFVSLQAVEWTSLIHEGARPWTNPWGAPQFGASFFLLTGFHGLHVSMGVLLLAIVAVRSARGVYERKGSYLAVELVGLYWGFVDLVWVFLFPFFYLF
jgi:cytochrome c oxidase subunit 3